MRRPHRWFWSDALLIAVGVQRLLELGISRRNEEKATSTIGTASPSTYPLMVFVHVCLFVLPFAERRMGRQRLPASARIAALGALVGATGLRVWVIRVLGRDWNVRGRVTQEMRVVRNGPYRFVRHPNYVAVAAEMAALPLAADAPLSAAVLSLANAAVLAPRIRDEERLLDQVPGYREQMGRLPRFIPRAWRSRAIGNR